MRTCVNCLLPSAVPGSELDDQGVCALCRDHSRSDEQAIRQRRLDREKDLEQALADCRGKGQYDCLVCLSGGKDSCYLLYKVVREYGLHALAFTVNLNITDIAWGNIHRTIDRLEAPHVTYTPPKAMYRKMFRYLLQNQEPHGAVRTVCYVCAPLTEGYALALAMEKNIPLILAGYSPGQPDPSRMVYEFSREMICHTDWTPKRIRDSGLFTEAECSLFWNPHRYPSGSRFPRYLAPFHAWEYSQADTMKAVVELGLVAKRRHASPVFSNCPLNWLLMYSDLRNLGYNPYAPEFSDLIRRGKASRWYWRLMAPIVDSMIRHKVFLGRNVRTWLDKLDLRPEDLKITESAPNASHASSREASEPAEEANPPGGG